MRVDPSHTAPWSRVADHGQKVGWRGEALPPGQAKKQAAAPAPAEPVPTTPVPATPVPTVPEATTPEAPVVPSVDVLA